MILKSEHLVEVRTGDRLIVDSVVHKVEKDLRYNGGYRCGGVSVKHLFDNNGNIEWIRYAS